MVFEITNDYTRTNRKYNTTRRGVTFKVKEVPSDVADPDVWIKNGVLAIVNRLLEDVNPNDKIGFTFSSEDLYKDAYLSFRDADKLTAEQVWELLESIHQSNSTALQSETFRITATIVKLYRGAGRQRSYNTFEEECGKRRGIIQINNKDNLCLARALVVAIAYALKAPYMNQIRRNIGKKQDIETQKLLAESGLIMPPEGAGIEELKCLQQHLKDYKITVYKYNTKGRDVLFEGPDAEKKLNLLHHNSHFNVITSLTSAFVCDYYCETCHTPYNNKNEHHCRGNCPCCLQTPPCEKTRTEITCDNCNRKFRGQICYDKHVNDVCKRIHRCLECMKTFNTKRQHICGEMYCKTCRNYQHADHLCYIQPDRRQPKTEKTLFVFYDLETQQETVGLKGEKIHIPNVCVFQQRCDICIEDGNEKPVCAKCGHRRQIIKCNDVIQSFLHHLLTIRKTFKKVVVIAHNGQAFDHQFILRHVLEQTDLQPELIMRGSKIIMMSLSNIKFIDSLNYFPMSLAKLPGAFDLGGELKKGYFPHFFNTQANEQYVGSLPAPEFYGVDSMKEDERVAFLEWHKLHENDTFDMQKDLVDYCISDVDILTKACLKFRKMFLEECNVCPFTEAVTIASACNLVYRRNFLRPNTIGLIPRGGYRNTDNQSKIATSWLIWEELQRGVNIIHSAKQREPLVDGVKVDGFCAETKQVFEFNGCYFHGCVKCFNIGRDRPLHEDPSDTLSSRYERTQKKTQRLRERGYNVVEMWECDFRHLMENNKLIKATTEDHPLLVNMPLDPRDAFYGGRTGNCKTYYECKPGEKIKYVDVCSLYPWVCKYGKFPVGHPTVHVGDQCSKLDLNSTEGLIKCKVLPPTNLYHPVLPVKMNNKLIFTLCNTCALAKNQSDCTHNEDERALVSTWVIDEVRKAVEMGYTIMDVYEVWQYRVVQLQKKTAGLFSGMMNKFIKMKQQASGWPTGCLSEEDKQAYIKEFLEREDVQLQYNEILKNEGLRSLAKLMLNSFWGKFGQRENQPKTTTIRQPNEFYNLLNNPALIVGHIEDITDEVLVVSWEYKDEAAELLSTVNVCIAAYTTAQARLKLYSYLEKLGPRCLYYDTDSVIYISRDGEYEIPTGNFLGEMTDELEGYGEGSYILVFASGGPKNYSYVVFSPKNHTYFTCCKVKGFTLTYNASQLINYYSMINIVTDFKDPLYITSSVILRTKQHQVITKETTKAYKPCCEKRKFTEDHDSVPYGYKKSRRNL